MALEGSLQDMSLVDLIQIFQTGSKSGVLFLKSDRSHGLIFAYQGRLIDAALVDGPQRRVLAVGDEAVIELLQWDEATFTFKHDPSVGQRPRRIVRDGERLVLEGMRRRENPLAALPYHGITPDARLALVTPPSEVAAGVRLSLHQWQALNQISQSRTLRTLSAQLGLELQQATRVVAELVAIGLVEVERTAAQPQPRSQMVNADRAQRQITLNGVDIISKHMIAPTSAPRSTLLDAVIRRIQQL